MKILKCFLLVLAFTTFAYGQADTIHIDKGTYPKTVKEWTGSLMKVNNIDSTTYVVKKSGGFDRSHKAGHRDAIIWVPNTTDLSKDITLLMWFHGHWGYVPSRTFEDRTLRQILPYAKNKNLVLVIPEMPWSVHTQTPTSRNSQVWIKPDQFMAFINQVQEVMGKHNEGNMLGDIDYRIVGHSAGGSVIKRLGITGDICKLNPSMIVWSDSSYGRWLEDALSGCLGNMSTLTKVFVKKGGAPWGSAVRFMTKFQKVPRNVELHVMTKPWTHKSIGDNIVKLSGVLE